MISSTTLGPATPRQLTGLLLHRIATFILSSFIAILSMEASNEVLSAESQRVPNIVLILADDMGYGDVRTLNPDSKIPTPNLDRLAGAGMTFTDGHSPSAVCTPTRYGLLTGRYCWRSPLKEGVLGGYSPPLIDADRPTIATLLSSQGYRTAGIGKWHLGMTMPMQPGHEVEGKGFMHGDPGVDFAGVISDGPVQRGFDEYFGVSASLDMAPFVYVRNDRFAMQPALEQQAVKVPHFVRNGPRSEDFVIDEVLDRLVEEAVTFISDAAAGSKPFFLYLPLTAPHKPTQPHERFRGRTELGEYGDFVAQVDWSVGQVLAALDDARASDDTLVFYSSDNGSYMYRYDDSRRKDHVDDAAIQGFRAEHHTANGPFRGTKADVWEAGHHVPLFVRWPGQIERGTTCAETVCLTDLFATCADVVGAELDNDAAEDSFSLLPMLLGKDAQRGAPVIHHSANGMFSIRDEKWKLVLGNGSGGRQQPRGEPFGKPYQLYDLSSDIGETRDVAAEQPDVVAAMTERFQRIHDAGRSVEREAGGR